MENVVLENSFNWTVIWSFLSCVLLVVFSVAILFIRDSREKQKLYRLFAGHMGEYIVVLSPKMEFLYGLPIFSSDPFFNTLYRERSLENFLPAADWIRISAYFKDTDKHPNMPFVLSYDDGGEAPIWYELRCVRKYYSSVEFHYVCFVRNISREVESRKKKEESEQKLKMLLQNTGDFLWKFDIENRKLTILTQVSGESFRSIPIPVGEVDLLTLIPEHEYNLLLDQMNLHVLKYHHSGSLDDGFLETKMRGYRTDKSLAWYSLRCKMELSDENRLFYRGVARRMEVMLDSPVFGSEKDAILSASMLFPDIRIFWVDRNFIVLGGNLAFAQDVKLNDPDAVIGKSLNDLTSSLHSPMFVQKVGDVFDLQKSVVWKDSYLRTNQYIIFNAVPLIAENNMVQKALCVYMILDQKEFRSDE